jgi:hypothetical protein
MEVDATEVERMEVDRIEVGADVFEVVVQSPSSPP